MQRPVPLTRDVVLIGGGHAHALVLRMWGMRPLPGARVTVINPAPTAPYTGMLPGHIAGHYDRDALEIDLVRLATFAGARLVMGLATGIDRAAGRVRVAGQPDIRYDVASIDVGITSAMPDLPGFGEHGVAAKPLGSYAGRWAAFCARVAAGEAPPDVAVIGAGVAGVELALAMHHRLTGLGAEPRVTLVEASMALPGLAERTRAVLLDRLRRAGIRLIEHARATAVTADALHVSGSRTIPAALTVGAAGARPHPWLAGLGLAHRDGYLTVDDQLRSVSDPAIYACGDCADLAFAPRPKAGVYAVRAAPVLFRNLRGDLSGARRTRFRPQKDYLKLISLGAKDAVADRSGFTLSGRWLWRQKDRIDRAFMDKLDRLPPMNPPPLPADRAKGGPSATAPMPCAGCGSKLGPGTLAAVLDRLPSPGRADVLTRPGDDAAVLALGGTRQVLTVDHLRAFTEDPVTLTRIAAVHAMGDVWAMGARPQAALATVILPHMTDAMAEATLREITETAAACFAAEGAELAGGHSTFGAEMTLGFAVTGLADGEPVTLAGGRPGDALLLTKPLGSGTLLAAAMRGRARGPDLMAAFASMARSQSAAAARLASVATAMTDVTGFGLAGHLLAVCRASGCGATLDLAALPLYAGAEGLAASGIRSTLWPANEAAAAPFLTAPSGPRAVLLHDPQTAGGLLAAIPAGEADALLAAIRATGLPAARIGALTEGPPAIVAA